MMANSNPKNGQNGVEKTQPDAITSVEKARLATQPSVHAAAVMAPYQESFVGKEVDLSVIIHSLNKTFEEVGGGDLSAMESMLVSQATALQTIFTGLARRAHEQTQQRSFESYLGLALKAQAQSRATISALVDLKYPRQATFVKQANIAHGPQQVNNGALGGEAAQRSGAEKTAVDQNKLLEGDDGQRSSGVDAREAQKAERSHSRLATMEPVHRPQKRRGQGEGIA